MGEGRTTHFAETMEGTLRLARGEGRERGLRLDLRVDTHRLLRPLGSTTADVTGRVRVSGWADDPHATGRMLIAPLAQGRIDYQVRFTAQDGRAYVLEGHKSPTWRDPLRSMTFLPVRLRPAEEDGTGGPPVASGGEGVLRFRLRGLPRFMASWRLPAPPAAAGSYDSVRPGRLNVWYSTFSDPATGTGYWFHHELVRPVDGAPYTHGWAAVYPPDASPVLERFGPHPLTGDPLAGVPGFRCPSAVATATRLRGRAGRLAWDLEVSAGSAPLHTFPRLAWRRRLLPAVHVVPQVRARCSGSVRLDGQPFPVADAVGAGARIVGRGNAHRWAWLHADLDDDTVLEVVAAVSTLPLLRRLPPLVFLRLRGAGRDWPRGDWRSALGVCGARRFTARPELPAWSVRGRAGGRRVTVRVHLPEEHRTAVAYTDPDGSGATCHNSERADVHVRLERRSAGRWRTERVWDVRSTAHAEVGLR
ncbi:hypothetical protein [Streptomyces galbus]|uniref:Uncharacterized protein n=1 Tax=Streptomyces galbus TaxID=33898 RepID=A0A4U5W6E3_STRGB|nr:hypothetical protein [Streptomyces galbus]TKS97093.1 hypothetical protein E4U92_33670 [Streptomyces galbus]